MLLVDLYFSRFLLQFISYQLLEYFVILNVFKFFTYIIFIELARLKITFSSYSTSDKSLISISLKALKNILSSSLSLTNVYFLV